MYYSLSGVCAVLFLYETRWVNDRWFYIFHIPLNKLFSISFFSFFWLYILGSIFESLEHLTLRTRPSQIRNGSLGPYSYALSHMASAVKASFLKLRAMVKVAVSNLATYAGFRPSELLWVKPRQCTTLSIQQKNEEPHFYCADLPSLALTYRVDLRFCLFTKV